MMFSKAKYDAIVIGSGPNGLACAITLAQKGLAVAVVERSETPGGGTRTQELTLPGFLHDVCSAVHPLAVASPFFKTLPLAEHGLKWIYGGAELAHPFDDGSAALTFKSVERTAELLGTDRERFAKFFSPLVERSAELFDEILAPVLHVPKHLGLLARFGTKALFPADTFANAFFKEEKARALFMGTAAHSISSLKSVGSSAVGLVLQTAAMSTGWPIPEGGSRNISRALVSYFESLGGEMITSVDVQNIDDLPNAERFFFDLTPRQILQIAGSKLPDSVTHGLKNFRYGPGVFKIDWALTAPIPWMNSDCAKAPTVHLGGKSNETVASEESVVQGNIAPRPFVLLSQPSLFDQSRAPSGQHTAWAYCHVPNSCKVDMTDAIENQIERFAPGFKKLILQKHVMSPAAIEAYNPNYVGGDISGGAVNLKQLLFRPRFGLSPYHLGGQRYWICSSSTPPGPGVHGMCGNLAARAALNL